MPEAASGLAWHGLHDVAVRDLAWLLASEDLFAAAPAAASVRLAEIPGLIAWCAPWLAQLAREPARLHAALAQARPTRLGRYAESLLKFFVEQAAPLRLIAANLPLRSHGRTIGECDFLLETRAGLRLHWELAVKCYLGAPHSDAARLSDFVGPNLADRLDLKHAHLIGHQLRLAEHPAFASLGYAGPWLPQLYAKGWLFHHRGEAGALPPELNPAHSRGFWVTHAEWAEWADRYPAGTLWSALPRLAWLAPRRFEAGPHTSGRTDAEASGPGGAEIETPQSAAEWSARLAGLHAPFMIAACAPGEPALAGERGPREEIARGFLVPDDWPAHAAAYAAAVL